MIYEYQVFYRDGASELRSLLVRASRAERAQALLEKIAGVKVEAIGEERLVVDWAQPTWSREEAGAFLKCGDSKIDTLMGQGTLPKARNGRPIFFTRQLEAVVQSQMDLSVLEEKEQQKAA